MLTLYTITLEVDVLDAKQLAATAAAHAQACGLSREAWEDLRWGGDSDPTANDLLMLFDPGGGGQAYPGGLEAAGCRIEHSSGEELVPFEPV